MIRSTIKDRNVGIPRKQIPKFMTIVKKDFSFASNAIAERFAATFEDLAIKCDSRGLSSTVHGELDERTSFFGIFHCIEEADDKVTVSYIVRTISKENGILPKITEKDIQSATDELQTLGIGNL